MGLAVHPTKPNVFATAAEDGLLLIMDSRQRKVVDFLLLPARAHSLAFSPEGKHLAVGFDLGVLVIYDAESLQEVRGKGVGEQCS